MNDYPAGYNDLDVIRQALALQQQAPPQQPMQFPQATPPAQQYYGPAHQAISQLFQQSLMQQAQPGLLAQPSAQQMGLLSTQMTPATSVPMPITGGGELPMGQYYRMTPDFWQNIRMDPKTGVVSDVRNAPVKPGATAAAPAVHASANARN